MRVYILCGAHAKSGGPELAHQFCNAVNSLTDYAAKMCYVDLDAPVNNCLPVDTNAEEAYACYKTEHASGLEEMDQEENLVIVPEGLTYSIEVFKKAEIALWWMSVDNYIVSTKERNLEMIERRCNVHLVQSFYAKKYVEKHFSGEILFLSDYINLQHGTFLFPAEYRRDIALYNPAKGYEKIKKLIEKSSWLSWVPLVGLDLEKTILYMQSAKVYVDLGNHPGKDRIPREAAVNGCCVITNRAGSAAYQEDVPIPEKYKFEEKDDYLDKIDALLRDICRDFPGHQKEFEDYRNWIHGEKERFDRETTDVIERIAAKKEERQ